MIQEEMLDNMTEIQHNIKKYVFSNVQCPEWANKLLTYIGPFTVFCGLVATIVSPIGLEGKVR